MATTRSEKVRMVDIMWRKVRRTYVLQFQKIDFPKISDLRGKLTFVQFPDQIPFEIERVFWTYDVPGGETRGGHAYRLQHEVIISLSGSFDVIITHRDKTTSCISLNRSHYGLYLPPGIWRHMENFSTNALSLHLSSMAYNAEDYIHDFHAYQSHQDS